MSELPTPDDIARGAVTGVAPRGTEGSEFVEEFCGGKHVGREAEA